MLKYGGPEEFLAQAREYLFHLFLEVVELDLLILYPQILLLFLSTLLEISPTNSPFLIDFSGTPMISVIELIENL